MAGRRGGFWSWVAGFSTPSPHQVRGIQSSNNRIKYRHGEGRADLIPCWRLKCICSEFIESSDTGTERCEAANGSAGRVPLVIEPTIDHGLTASFISHLRHMQTIQRDGKWDPKYPQSRPFVVMPGHGAMRNIRLEKKEMKQLSSIDLGPRLGTEVVNAFQQ